VRADKPHDFSRSIDGDFGDFSRSKVAEKAFFYLSFE
jgi:hypothetical protein